MLKRGLAVVLLCGAAISTAQAQGNSAEGQILARETCSACHNVEPGGPLKLFPPSFASIASYRSAEVIYWKIVAPPLHSTMPRFGDLVYLSPDNVDNVVAYIMSLEEQ